jgi:hypothetical protein
LSGLCNFYIVLALEMPLFKKIPSFPFWSLISKGDKKADMRLRAKNSRCLFFLNLLRLWLNKQNFVKAKGCSFLYKRSPERLDMIPQNFGNFELRRSLSLILAFDRKIYTQK